MSIIVQKFGGTSVADSEKILAAARKAIRAQQEGNQVVMVVSAMGNNTDVLIDLAKQITDEPPAREMDMLLSTGEQVSVALMAMAIHSLGHEAISMTGGQIGIKTDSTHTKARIQSISTDRIRRGASTRARSSSPPGFQGIDETFEHHHARPRRQRHDGRGPGRRAAAPTPARSTPTSTASTRPTRGSCPRPAASTRISYDEMLELASAGRRRDAQPVDRVRQEVRRADPRPQQFQRHARAR